MLPDRGRQRVRCMPASRNDAGDQPEHDWPGPQIGVRNRRRSGGCDRRKFNLGSFRRSVPVTLNSAACAIITVKGAPCGSAPWKTLATQFITYPARISVQSDGASSGLSIAPVTSLTSHSRTGFDLWHLPQPPGPVRESFSSVVRGVTHRRRHVPTLARLSQSLSIRLLPSRAVMRVREDGEWKKSRISQSACSAVGLLRARFRLTTARSNCDACFWALVARHSLVLKFVNAPESDAAVVSLGLTPPSLELSEVARPCLDDHRPSAIVCA